MLNLQAMGVDVGIYTFNRQYVTIVGTDFNEFRDLPLWWPQYNDNQDLIFYPFAGWTAALIHQYSGDANGPCGVTMDQNYAINF